MKNCIIIIFILSFTLVKAQEPLSAVAKIEVPNQIDSKNREDVKSFSKIHFKRPELTESVKNLYRAGNVMVSFWDINTDKTLEESKSDMEGLILNRELKQNNVLDVSEIVKVNNIRFHILKYHNDDEYSYRFYSENRNSKSINGFVKFKIEDKLKADKIFDNLVKSISFKK